MKISESLFSIPISVNVSRTEIADMKSRILRDFKPTEAAKVVAPQAAVSPTEKAKAPVTEAPVASTASQRTKL
jgi:hypothetical protein